MRIVTVINQKGGVGKTTFACHLALLARDSAQRTLLVDLDTQGNASGLLTGSVTVASETGGSADLFTNDATPCPRPTRTGIELLHGHQRLDAIDKAFDLADAQEVGRRIRKLPYDFVVVDTPPAIGSRHLAPFLWSDVAVIPLEPTAFGIQGLTQTLETLPEVTGINPDLACRVAINRMVKNSRRQAEYLAEIRAILEEAGIPLLEPYLTQRVHVADALDLGLPVWAYMKADPELRRSWRTFCERAAS